jgi:hypothetical protein
LAEPEPEDETEPEGSPPCAVVNNPPTPPDSPEPRHPANKTTSDINNKDTINLLFTSLSLLLIYISDNSIVK